MTLPEAYYHYLKYRTIPKGLDDAALAFLEAARPRSRVLMRCSDSQLQSIVGAIILGLADHIEANPDWVRLWLRPGESRFYQPDIQSCR